MEGAPNENIVPPMANENERNLNKIDEVEGKNISTEREKTLEYYTHPESQSDEVLLTNVDRKEWEHIGRKTKRHGTTAYDIHGEVCGHYPDFYPVFVKKTEMKQAGYTLVEIPKEQKRTY